MERRAAFKRMVLGLPHNARDYISVAFTAELADLLGLDFVGIFADDERLIDLALIPCVREFRISGNGWHPLDVEHLGRSISQAAADARRLFSDAAKSLHVATRFDLVKGQIDKAVGAQTKPDDIIVVIEPKSAVERISYQFRQFVHMALNGPAAALLVPSQVSRREGPIVAIASSEHDLSIRVGLALAETIREKLLIISPKMADAELPATLSTSNTVPVDRRSFLSSELNAVELQTVLGTAQERLVVMSPGVDSLLPVQLASDRGVPVLVTARDPSNSLNEPN